MSNTPYVEFIGPTEIRHCATVLLASTCSTATVEHDRMNVQLYSEYVLQYVLAWLRVQYPHLAASTSTE